VVEAIEYRDDTPLGQQSMYLAEKIYRLVKKLTGTPSFPGERRATVTPGGK
jgi:hypothetical protein